MCFGVGGYGGEDLGLWVCDGDVPCPAAVCLTREIQDAHIGAVLECGDDR